MESLRQLPQGRCTATDILDLLDVPAVRERFGIDESDLPQLARWIDQARIRWGLNSEQRKTLAVPGFEQHRWAFGLQRMLAGDRPGAGPARIGLEALGEGAGHGAARGGRPAGPPGARAGGQVVRGARRRRGAGPAPADGR